jgi:hypothetical protein
MVCSGTKDHSRRIVCGHNSLNKLAAPAGEAQTEASKQQRTRKRVSARYRLLVCAGKRRLYWYSSCSCQKIYLKISAAFWRRRKSPTCILLVR